MKKNPKKTSGKKTKKSGTGAVAANFHEGSRSEVLADYLFSSWGTVTPARRQDDYGVDLYCTLTERLGQKAWVTDYFVVQVKSTNDPWIFRGKKSVQWLIEHPVPLFLSWVDKKEGVVRIYHVLPRFVVSALGNLPNHLELTPEQNEDGTFVKWENGKKFSLPAPILQVTIADLLNEKTMVRFKQVFAQWVRLDRENHDLLRQGLLRFRMPASYKVNEAPSRSVGEMGLAIPKVSQIQKGILTAAESAECIGGQLGRLEDRLGALFSALFVDHLQKTYPDVFKELVRWQTRLPADLGTIVCHGLNKTPKKRKGSPYLYTGIESVENSIQKIKRVKDFL